MTKANMELSNGTKITIEGTPKEVAKAIQLMQGKTEVKNPKREKPKKATKKVNSGKKGVMDRIRTLISEDFFEKPRLLQDIKNELARNGHIYPVTSISPTLVRLVRSKELRRIKDNGNWTYVQA
jgi:hypothetical protein